MSPETASALFVLLNGIADAPWQKYETELIELMMEERNQYPASQQAFDFDHDSPF